jgi:O-antigen/teichoic acid export membrane protein
VIVVEPAKVQRENLSIPDTAITAPPSSASAPESRFRSEMGHISRHSAVFFAGTLFTAAAGYLFKIYVARMLGADALGVYALGMTIVGFFGLFNGLGLPQAAVRFVAAYSATLQYQRLHAFLRRAIVLLFGANIILAGLMIMVGPWVARKLYQSQDLVPYLGLFAMIAVTGAFGGFLGQVLAGYKDVALRTLITSFIASPLNIVLGVILLALGMGLRGYVLAQVASSLVVLCLLIAVTWKLTPAPARHRSSGSTPLEPEVFWFSAAVFGVSCLEYLLSQTDKIVMGAFLDVRHVGIYSVAASLVTFVPVALQSVNQIFAPTIADLHARHEQDLLGRIFQTLTKWIVAFTLPLSIVMIVYSKPLMRLFGPAFEVGWIVLILGTLGQLINAGTGSVGFLLLMSGNQNRLVRIQTVMAVFLVVATLGLVRPFGMIGVAAAAALTTAITNYLCLKEVRSALGLSPYNRTYFRLIGPGLVSIVLVLSCRLFLPNVHPEWLMIGVALVAAYASFGALLWLIGLDDDDRMIVDAVQRRLLRSRQKASS